MNHYLGMGLKVCGCPGLLQSMTLVREAAWFLLVRKSQYKAGFKVPKIGDLFSGVPRKDYRILASILARNYNSETVS